MTDTRRTALGRGLSALIPEAAGTDEISHVSDGAVHLPIGHIRAAETQPRTHFDEARITALAESIKADGILQPIVVRRVGQATFIIIAGERRYRASRRAGRPPHIAPRVAEQPALWSQGARSCWRSHQVHRSLSHPRDAPPTLVDHVLYKWPRARHALPSGACRL